LKILLTFLGFERWHFSAVLFLLALSGMICSLISTTSCDFLRFEAPLVIPTAIYSANHSGTNSTNNAAASPKNSSRVRRRILPQAAAAPIPPWRRLSDLPPWFVELVQSNATNISSVPSISTSPPMATNHSSPSAAVDPPQLAIQDLMSPFNDSVGWWPNQSMVSVANLGLYRWEPNDNSCHRFDSVNFDPYYMTARIGGTCFL
jgi:hypothetical protein